VVSNRPGAPGLALARAAGVPTAVVDHRAQASREHFDAALADVVDAFAPDLLVLAGFMRILGAGFVQRHAGRMLNIHPSLLPAFPGLDTHARALAAGCQVAGATVHYVVPEVDHGPIVLQGVVPVRPGDDAAALGERVLAMEHRILPLAVRWWVEDRLLTGADGRVRHRDGASQVLM
jgi:phosphoribosylglycinamide formyltransferase-1